MDLRSLRKHLHFLMVFRIPILCSYVVLVMKRRNGYGKSCLPEASVCFFTNHRIFCVLLLIFFFIFLFVFRQRVTLQNSLYVPAKKEKNIGLYVAFGHLCVIQLSPCYKHKCVSPVMYVNINVSMVHFAVKYH